MDKSQCLTAADLMEQIEGVNLHNKKGSKLKFRLYLTQTMSETPIEALDLSVRSSNCLKRAGIEYIGDIAEAIASGVDLASIRNCGSKSRREIMEKLMIFQYYSLPENKKEPYLKEVVQLNT